MSEDGFAQQSQIDSESFHNWQCSPGEKVIVVWL